MEEKIIIFDWNLLIFFAFKFFLFFFLIQFWINIFVLLKRTHRKTKQKQKMIYFFRLHF